MTGTYAVRDSEGRLLELVWAPSEGYAIDLADPEGKRGATSASLCSEEELRRITREEVPKGLTADGRPLTGTWVTRDDRGRALRLPYFRETCPGEEEALQEVTFLLYLEGREDGCGLSSEDREKLRRFWGKVRQRFSLYDWEEIRGQ